MKNPERIYGVQVGRRSFLGKAGLLGLGTAATLALSTPAFGEKESSAERTEETGQAKDTVKEIFTAALTAEDLASTFHYNGLIGLVIQDPNLAGAGGSATNVTRAGSTGNVNYLQAALTEEISHANLFRSLLGISGQIPIRCRHSTFRRAASIRSARSSAC